MNVRHVRPNLTDLVFLVFSRPLHPELFSIFREQQIVRDAYQAVIRITDAGHIIEVQRGANSISEVVTRGNGPLPKSCRLLASRLRGERTEKLASPGVVYQASYGVERMPAELFSRISQELGDGRAGKSLCHNFSPRHRLAPSPLSQIWVEARANSLLVHAFHTFPDDFAIVKTQSLFECVDGR